MNDEVPPVEPAPATLPLVTVRDLPYLTAEFPGIGGRWKDQAEDFVVEEIPAYEPSGAGEHLFLWIEKKDVSANDLVHHVGRSLRCSPRDIGVAGLKDRRAITRQYLSVPAKLAADVPKIDTDSIRVLRSAQHGNKLKTGHLRGNRFSILIREVGDQALERANAIAEQIRTNGFPNYYGAQRFGHGGETLQLGLDLLTGRKKSRDIPGAKRRFLLRLSLSAVQSDLFNRALASRLNDRLLNTVLAGDVMEVVASGGKFIADDVTAEQARYHAGEIAVTGPMFGLKMREPTGVPLQRETELLDWSGLGPEHFAKYLNLMTGTRRPYVIRPGELGIEADPAGLRFQFSLPSGAYATMLLREFMKSDEMPLAPESEESSEDD